jgi:hypothetical protein
MKKNNFISVIKNESKIITFIFKHLTTVNFISIPLILVSAKVIEGANSFLLNLFLPLFNSYIEHLILVQDAIRLQSFLKYTILAIGLLTLINSHILIPLILTFKHNLILKFYSPKGIKIIRNKKLSEDIFLYLSHITFTSTVNLPLFILDDFNFSLKYKIVSIYIVQIPIFYALIKSELFGYKVVSKSKH